MLDLAELKTRFYESVYAKPADIARDRPTFSFTFDDVPASVLTWGLPVLDEHDVKATFYIASQLAGSGLTQESGEFIALTQAGELQAAGHHIACHTFSHYSLARGTAAGLAEDSARNRAELKKALGAEVDGFSYPFGEIALSAKRLLRNEYETLRSNRPGINRGRIDMAYLRSEQIYTTSLDRERIAGLIEDCGRSGGWLIFYTHGIHPDPGPWGATPEDLRWVIERCRAVPGEILDVRRASERVRL